MQIHNAAVTGSLTYNGVDISSITGSTSNINSLNAITASLLSTTASLNSYTGSNNTNISNIHSTTASLNTFTGSAQSQLSALQVTSGSNITRISALESASGSAITRLSALEVTSGSNITRISALEVTSGSNITRISALESASGSAITRLSALEVTSGSNISRLSSLEARTGSYATTGSNIFVGSQTITGSILGSGSLSINGCIVSTGQIVAQTINVQQVTSSIVYSCGSNTFGTAISNSQVMTGSVLITGSLSAVGNACFQGTTTITCNLSVGNTSTCSSLTITGVSVGGFTAGYIGWGACNQVTPGLYLNSPGTNVEITTGFNERVALSTGTGLQVYTNNGGGVYTSRFLLDRSGNGCIFGDLQVGGIYRDFAGEALLQTQTNCVTFIGTSGAGAAGRALNFLAGNVSRLCIATTGVATFTCQVCSPFLYACAADNSTVLGLAGATRGLRVRTGSSKLTIQGVDNTLVGSFQTLGLGGSDIAFETNGTTERLRIANTGEACFACQACSPSFIGISATANGGSPNAIIAYSGNDCSAIWRGAINAIHNPDVTISAGSSIGITMNPLSSTGSSFYGSVAIKAVRENATANNQDTALAFWTRSGASNSTVDTEKMRITSGGNVGIGTISPNNTLDIRGTLSLQSDTAYFRIRRASGTDVGYITDGGTWGDVGADFSIGASSANLRFYTNNSVTERMRLDSAGRLGIGTTNPSQRLQVDGAIRLTSNPSVTGDGSSVHFWNQAGVGATIAAANFQVQTNGTSVAMHINSSQNVGIGTTNPEARLNINGDFADMTGTITYSTNTKGIILNQDAGGGFGMGLWFRQAGLTAGIGSTRVSSGDWATDLRFYTHPSVTTNQNILFERMRINSEGNVGIGTVSPASRLTLAPPNCVNASTIEFTNTDNAVISSHFSLTLAVNNSSTQSNRSIVFASGNKGYGNQCSIIATFDADSGLSTFNGAVAQKSHNFHTCGQWYKIPFYMSKDTITGTATTKCLIVINNNDAFQELHFTIEYGSRLQGVSDQVTQTSLRTYGVNRFSSNTITVYDTYLITGGSGCNINTHAPMTVATVGNCMTVVKVDFSSTVSASSFVWGEVRIWSIESLAGKITISNNNY